MKTKISDSKRIGPTSSTTQPSSWATASRKALLAVMLAAGSMSMESCKPKVVAPIDKTIDKTIDKINRTTDNPEHKADFMKDVKAANLANGTAKLTFEAVWVPSADGKGGDYKLKPIPVINFDKAKEALEADASKLNIPLEKMGLEFYYRGNYSSTTGLSFAIPYSFLTSKSGEQIMKYEDFTKYITENSEGNPNQVISKNDSGFLRISSGKLKPGFEDKGYYTLVSELQVINPYKFGN